MKAGHPCGDACGMQRSCSSPTKPPTHSARDEQPDAADVKLPPSAKTLTTAPASSRLTTAASLARPSTAMPSAAAPSGRVRAGHAEVG